MVFHMLKIGFNAPHEQYQPLPLLEYAVEAEKAGFDSVWASDHFHPWAHTNAASGFAWVWMAALAERTKRVEIGTAVTCPTLRYNPAIVAQAFATLRAMYPDRIFIGLGTGEAMNEVPVGCRWPSFKERAERLEEAIRIMKLLWSGSFVNFKGKYYTLRKANLYTKPTSPPPIYVAASGATVAKIAGAHADGLLTIPLPENRYREVIFPALEQGAKSAGRDPDKIIKAVEVWATYDEDYEKALKSARFWAATLFPAMLKYEIFDPREIEEFGSFVGDEQIARYRFIGTKPEEHIKHLEKYIKMGFEHIYILTSSPDEIKALRMYGKHVLPYLHSTYGER
jgi:coenzyme F420-dependent glucose-6-phosphate dehydrogenase